MLRPEGRLVVITTPPVDPDDAEQFWWEVQNDTTQSGVTSLPPDAQRDLVARIKRRIEGPGGTLTVHHLAVVTIARRGGPAPAG